jgi:hypothetical protein
MRQEHLESAGKSAIMQNADTGSPDIIVISHE